jgi:hypothetical protein
LHGEKGWRKEQEGGGGGTPLGGGGSYLISIMKRKELDQDCIETIRKLQELQSSARETYRNCMKSSVAVELSTVVIVVARYGEGTEGSSSIFIGEQPKLGSRWSEEVQRELQQFDLNFSLGERHHPRRTRKKTRRDEKAKAYPSHRSRRAFNSRPARERKLKVEEEISRTRRSVSIEDGPPKSFLKKNEQPRQ